MEQGPFRACCGGGHSTPQRDALSVPLGEVNRGDH